MSKDYQQYKQWFDNHYSNKEAEQLSPTSEEIYKAYGLNINLPFVQLNGWQTITNYAKEHGITYRHVFKLIRTGKVASLKLPELNNLTLVRPKDE